MDGPKKVAVLALKRLLVELNEHRPDICIRYRLLGQMWLDNFLRVVEISENGVVLYNETINTFVRIPELSAIIQFELDKTFQSYQPYVHYEVVTSGEW
jgi:hypothetical protein